MKLKTIWEAITDCKGNFTFKINIKKQKRGVMFDSSYFNKLNHTKFF